MLNYTCHYTQNSNPNHLDFEMTKFTIYQTNDFLALLFVSAILYSQLNLNSMCFSLMIKVYHDKSQKLNRNIVYYLLKSISYFISRNYVVS